MPPRLILNELDIDLATLTAGLLVIIVIIIGGGADARSFDTSGVGAVAVVWIIRSRGILGVGISDVGHDVELRAGDLLVVPNEDSKRSTV